MSFVEPTAVEAKAIGDLASLFTWVGTPGNVRHPGTAAGALVKVLELEIPPDKTPFGGPATTADTANELLQWQIMVQFANIDAADFKQCVDSEWLYSKDIAPDAADDPDWDELRESTPSLPMRGAACSALRAAKIIVGIEKPRTQTVREETEDRAARAPKPVINPLREQTAKLHQLVDESLNADIPLIETSSSRSCTGLSKRWRSRPSIR